MTILDLLRFSIVIVLGCTLFSLAVAQERRCTLLFHHQDDPSTSVSQLEFLIASLHSRDVKSTFLFSTPLPPLSHATLELYERAIHAGHTIGLALNCSASTLSSGTALSMVAYLEPLLDQLNALFQLDREAQYQYIYFPCQTSLSASTRLALKNAKILPILNETVHLIPTFDDRAQASSEAQSSSMLLGRTNDPSLPYLARYVDIATTRQHVRFVPIEEQLLSHEDALGGTMIFNADSISAESNPVANSACGCHQPNDVRVASMSSVGWICSTLCILYLFI